MLKDEDIELKDVFIVVFKLSFSLIISAFRLAISSALFSSSFFVFDLIFKKRNRLRIATKYPNLTTEFMFSRGVTQFKLVKSLGATEIYPFTGSSEIITDITSTGATLKANKLRILKDGIILKSQACLLTSKKNKEVELLKVF